ncbi:biotin transporter BioY [Haloarchaeobius sp. DYHT-AS-18]|uniref:biotin transporter BioY n=1 Tax=Haloarchaeobius sp. DYHT-AS-18 TaxID=3446117 RepID=UPI003EBC3AE3
MADSESQTEGYGEVDLVEGETVKMVAASAMFAALAAALAQVAVPMPGPLPPVTLQTTAVFLAGLVLGARWGGFAMVLYILTGVAGAPVFAEGSAGLGTLVGASGGFIVGFLLAAVAIGAVVHRGFETRSLAAVSVPTQVVAICLGIAIIYVVGTPYMAFVLDWSLGKAFTFMLPFLPGDLAEMAAVIGLVYAGDLTELTG